MVHTPTPATAPSATLSRPMKTSNSQLHLFPLSSSGADSNSSANLQQSASLGPSGSMASASASSLGDETEGICIVCLENPRTTRLSCGHEILCRRCAIVVMKTKSACPTCRARITKVMFSKVFGQSDFVPHHEVPQDAVCPSAPPVDQYIEQRVSHEVARRRSVDENKLVLDGACRVADHLKRVCVRLTASNCLITYLSLADNFIGPAEALLLADALSKNQSVRFLNLSNNCLGSEGTKTICEALLKNNTITTIHLNTNQMDVAGAEAIARVLEKNTTIQTLRLYENAVGEKGTKALSKALLRNTTLTELSLRSNRIPTKGLQYLAKKLHLNTSLEKLDIGFNDRVNRREFPARVELK